MVFEFDIHCKENDGRAFLGTNDVSDYFTGAEIAEKEDAFIEADSEFEMFLYVNTAVTSTSY